jgi:pilin isopeptide linkage protein
MKEISGDGAGWTCDKTAYPVKVTITDNGQGQLYASVTYPDGTPNFNNVYKASDAPANIVGKVVGLGKKPFPGEFEFDVLDSEGNVVGKARNDENGNIIFPTLNLPDGEYDFTIVAPPDGGGWTFDVPKLPVHISVTDDGDGTSSAVITYPDGNVFHPKYKDVPVKEKITAQKVIHGWNNPEKRFVFSLRDINGKVVRTAQNIEGLIDFGMVNYTEPGTYVYTMEEDSFSAGAGWNTDPTVFPVVVTVTDDGQGNLECQISYPGGNVPVFDNFYVTADSSIKIAAKKVCVGKSLNDGQFEFELDGEDGVKLGTAKNDGNGDIIFPEFDLPEGEYDFTMHETTPDSDGFICDKKKIPVHVKVIDNGDGSTKAEVTYPNGAVFTNVYDSKPTTAVISAKSCVCGACACGACNCVTCACNYAGYFKFGLFMDNGEQIAQIRNDGCGDITFPEITFNAPGIYRYTIKELGESCYGWEFDKSIYDVAVTVTSDEQGALSANVTYDIGKIPTFTNSYKQCK